YRARASRPARQLLLSCRATPPLRGGALHKKSWAVIDRPYSLGCATVGALYERPRCIFCAKPRGGEYVLQFHQRRVIQTAANNSFRCYDPLCETCDLTNPPICQPARGAATIRSKSARQIEG